MSDLGRRALLTLRYDGPRAAVARVLMWPARHSPQARRFGLDRHLLERRRAALRWARSHPPAAGAVVLRARGARAMRGWAACLRYAAATTPGRVGIVGGRVIAPGGVIADAGLERAGEGFRSCYEGRPLAHGPALVPHPVLAVGPECMYLTAELVRELGPSAPATRYEAIELCLRAWAAGFEVLYEPAAALERAGATGPPEGDGQAFWTRQHEFFAPRAVTTPSGAARVVYVTEGTGRWGGHRVVFDDMRSLAARGHEVCLYTLEPAPEWTDLDLPVHTFDSYAELVEALAPLDAIKVATWWRTAAPVWRACARRGLPVYFVQDIESSYYPESTLRRREVLASYRAEFTYLTTSVWNRDRLAELGRRAEVIAPAIDPVFTPAGGRRREDMVLAIARSDALKRFELTLAAWRALPEARAELCLFGREPRLAPSEARFVADPSDAEVNRLLNECTVFVSTSAHEGFALPPLEAMATGAAVVCTDADGNRDYCVDGVNCLLTEPDPAAVARAITRLLRDPELRARLGAGGIETAGRHRPPARAEALDAFVRTAATGARPRAAPRV